MVRVRTLFFVCLGLASLSVAPAGPGRSLATPAPPRPQARQAPSVPPPTVDLTSYLPRAGEVPGWPPKGDPFIYRGEDLFTYIDGGADIYNEYGFRQVAVQDYASGSGQTVTLEVFEMDGSAAAFGMYTFKTSARGSEAVLGQGGRLEDYYLNFWEGPFIVTVTGFDDTPESIAAVRRIAGAVDGKLTVTGDIPSLAAAFPKDWAARGGLKYLRGPIGLRNQHPIFARQAIRFHEGVAGWPDDGVLAVVLKGQTPAEAEAILADAEKVFSSSPPFSDFRKKEGRFEARDARGNSIEGRLLDGGLGLVVTKGPAAPTDMIWERLRTLSIGP